MRLVLIILFMCSLTFFQNWELEEYSLPIPTFFEDMPVEGLIRNIPLQFVNQRLYFKDYLITDLNDFRSNIYQFIDLNEGSNRLRVILSANGNTQYRIIDSLFYEMRKNYLLSFFLLTNDQTDSVGLPILLPTIDIPEMPISINTSFDTVSFFRNAVLFNNTTISENQFLQICDSLIQNNRKLGIAPNQENTYSDIVYLLDVYLGVLFKNREAYSIEFFGCPYKTLKVDNRDVINQKYQKLVFFTYMN